MPVASFEVIPDGFRGTAATIRKMHELAAQGKINLSIQKIADSIVKKARCADRDYDCKAQAIYDFVKGYVRFERDPFGVEMVQEPLVTLKRRKGDCDDHGVVNSALAGSIGFPYAFKTLKADLFRPDDFSHVYTVVFVPKRGWVGFDTSVGSAYYGWEPPGKHPFKLWLPKVA